MLQINDGMFGIYHLCKKWKKTNHSNALITSCFHVSSVTSILLPLLLLKGINHWDIITAPHKRPQMKLKAAIMETVSVEVADWVSLDGTVTPLTITTPGLNAEPGSSSRNKFLLSQLVRIYGVIYHSSAHQYWQLPLFCQRCWDFYLFSTISSKMNAI